MSIDFEAMNAKATNRSMVALYLVATVPLTFLATLFTLGEEAKFLYAAALFSTTALLIVGLNKCQTWPLQVFLLLAAFAMWYFIVDTIASHFGGRMC